MNAPDHMLRRSENPCTEGGIQTCTPIDSRDPHALARDALAGLDAARIALTGLSSALQQGVNPQFEDPLNAADWRAQHRRGTLSRLETDPELRTFVLARIDRLTFDQVVA